jgi:hypothetical protein
MRLYDKVVAGAMLLLMLGVPAMACVIPDAQLTDAEKACCRQMANQCGKMEMPNGHSCCDTTVKPQQSALLKPAPSFSYDRVVLAFAPIAIALTPQQIFPDNSIRALRHPPPNIDSPSIEILRI